MYSAIHNLWSRDHNASNGMLPSMRRRGAFRCLLVHWSCVARGRIVVTRNKRPTRKIYVTHTNSKPGQNGTRPRNLAHKPQQQRPSAAKSSTGRWCVRGVPHPSSVGRHVRLAGGVVCSCCVCGGKELHTAAETVSATRRQFERPAALNDKKIGGRIGWSHGANHVSHIVITPVRGTCRFARDAAFPPSSNCLTAT